MTSSNSPKEMSTNDIEENSHLFNFVHLLCISLVNHVPENKVVRVRNKSDSDDEGGQYLIYIDDKDKPFEDNAKINAVFVSYGDGVNVNDPENLFNIAYCENYILNGCHSYVMLQIDIDFRDADGSSQEELISMLDHVASDMYAFFLLGKVALANIGSSTKLH